MKTFQLLLFPLAMVCVLASPTVGGAEGSEDGDLVAQIRNSMPEGSDGGLQELQYALDVVQGIDLAIGIWEVQAAGLIGLGLEVMGPVTGAVAVWVAMGVPHAEAINATARDQRLSGFSRGVVLGADDRPADYVKEHFVKWSPDPNSVYPEYKSRFQQAYNQALVAGYAQGQRLLEDKRQRGAFFEDLYRRMRPHPSVTYGEDQDQWSDRSWVDYYIETAATFRRDHLEPAS